ncbi:hypothetical protein O6H91_07G012200 [Diphasiastrum complanatum]|uniref:Uncharacterized protein n=1 Tax=Diphasiastrum complanatum TaxID=34168 RepID=A0ACC2D2E7_DIPCM|nr:hypothetical protein O6H91_07G012200 [Diphasiastrum complanatum]
MSGDRNVQVVVSLGCRCRQPSKKGRGQVDGELTPISRPRPSNASSFRDHADTYSAVSATLGSARQSQGTKESLLKLTSSAPNSEFSVSEDEFLKGSSIIRLPIMPRDAVGANDDILTPIGPVLSGICFYIDPALSRELQLKIAEAAAEGGASLVGGDRIATHIICERSSLAKYVQYEANIVTPLWVLKTVREKIQLRLVHLSADLVTQLLLLLDNAGKSDSLQDANNVHMNIEEDLDEFKSFNQGLQVRERQVEMLAAKAVVRKRRGPQQQPCRTLPQPLTPASLLEFIYWSVTEPPSTARLHADMAHANAGLQQAIGSAEQSSMIIFDEQDTTKKPILSMIPESEASQPRDIAYGGAFLTILFPIDRFSEMGPSSRSYFSPYGFTAKQILDHVYAFYEEYISFDEIQTAVYTDSKYADKLRTIYATPETIELGYVPVKRSTFIGGKKLFGGLRRLGSENPCQIYELQLNVIGSENAS